MQGEAMSDWKRIAEDLREQVAALTKERDEALRVTFDVRVIEQLAAAQATNAKLREALKFHADYDECTTCISALAIRIGSKLVNPINSFVAKSEIRTKRHDPSETKA
jgi:hypothetical protein